MKREKNVTTSSSQKLENILFLHIITTFHNFALITETSQAETVVGSILENRNIYVWFIHFWIKKTTKYKIYNKKLK